jgi:hypothetical protein
MNGYIFTLAVLVIVLGFIAWMVKQAMKDAGTVKFSWGEWQELSARAKETLIAHGYDPPVAPHATFHRPAVYGGKTPRRPLGRDIDHDTPHTAPKGGGGVGDLKHAKYLQGLSQDGLPDGTGTHGI